MSSSAVSFDVAFQLKNSAAASMFGMRDCDHVVVKGVYYAYNPVKDRDVKSQDVITTLKRHGWMLVRIRGSHHQFYHPMRAGLVTVPHPRKDIKPGTLAQIWRQAGLKL